MDEKIPPLATYPPPRKPREKGLSIGAQRAIFGLAGLIAGGALVLATLKVTAPDRDMVARGGTPVDRRSRAPQDRQLENAPGSNPSATPDDPNPKPDEEKAPTGSPPFNPFEGNITMPMPSSEISGHVSAGPPPDVNSHTDSGKPTGSNTPVVPEETSIPRGYLVSLRMDVENPETAVQAIQGVASRMGGSAFQFDETASQLDAEGAIVLVPAAKAEEAQKLLGNVGSIVVSDTWSGSSGARLDRIENDAQNRLSDLRIQRQELLVKYFEDAPQIRHIDEDMARINKSLAALRAKKPSADMAVLKIKFLT